MTNLGLCPFAIKKAAVVYSCFLRLTSCAYEEAAHGLQGLQGLQPVLAAHGLHPLLAALQGLQGLQPLQPFLAAHGLADVALHGLVLAAHGEHLVDELY